jgi:hypothetical protein
MLSRRLWLTLLLCLVGSSGFAQRFSIHLQGGAAPGSFGGRGQFEASLEFSPGLTFGTRLGVQNAPIGGVLEMSLSPFALYRFFIFGDGQWWFTGYVGAQFGAYYSPNRPASPPPDDDLEDDDDGGGSGSGSGNSGSGSSGDDRGAENDNDKSEDSRDNRRSGRDPRGDDDFDPVQTLEFTALGLSGIDGAYFVDDRLSLYFGLEVDLRALPTLEPVAYPYLEVDYLLLDNLTGAIGAYLSLKPSGVAYLLYTNLFYDLTREVGLRFEVAFGGSLSGYLRLTIRL